jgi:membrane-associated phospholipid phosphatase
MPSLVPEPRRSLSALLLVLLVITPGAALAQEAPLTWDYPTFRTEEAAATLAFGVGTFVAEVVQPTATEGRWQGGVLFDDAVGNLLRARSPEGQERALHWSDTLWRISLAYPLVDIWVVALGVHRSPEVAAQMLLIDLQSFALTGSLTLVGQLLTRRERPYVARCGTEQGFSPCGTKRDYTSFPSGHAAIAMTGAMLTCSHHRRLELLDSRAASALLCGASVSVALGAGVLRIVGDRHYATDVLAGFAVGVLSGYVLPAWLHYGFSLQAPSRPGRPRVRWTAAPQPMGEGGVGLALVGVLP